MGVIIGLVQLVMVGACIYYTASYLRLYCRWESAVLRLQRLRNELQVAEEHSCTPASTRSLSTPTTHGWTAVEAA